VDGANDHRIVMAAAVAAACADRPVRITGAQAVEKSYPSFFSDFEALGGNAHVEYAG
jgi:3-phosphoshikimate 1-carboxyvinyltransferase